MDERGRKKKKPNESSFRPKCSRLRTSLHRTPKVETQHLQWFLPLAPFYIRILQTFFNPCNCCFLPSIGITFVISDVTANKPLITCYF